MKNSFLAVLCGFFCLQSNLSANNWTIKDPEEITEQFLISENKVQHTEHISHMKRVFNKIRVKTLLEFGVGYATKFFLDHSEHVISVEFITPGTGPEWMNHCRKLFKNYYNWTPLAYFSGRGLNTSWAPYKYIGLDSVYIAAAYWPVNRTSYASIDPSYLDDLDHFMTLQVEKNPIDVAFVDTGICLRGNLVQTLFNKVPIIAAHDISPKETRHLYDGYGYGEMQIPDNYVEIYLPDGPGTAFWIMKDPKYRDLINDLQVYATLRDKLKVRRSLELVEDEELIEQESND